LRSSSESRRPSASGITNHRNQVFLAAVLNP
jgi:hypothetical protein